MNDKIEIKPQVISPLKKICMTIGELPTSYLETMTYYEMLVWFTNYLRDTIIPVVNNNGEAVTELQNLFVELQTFVNNYFDNLDVQQEINNKLDKMVESGELEIILSKILNKTNSLLNFSLEYRNASEWINGLTDETTPIKGYVQGMTTTPTSIIIAYMCGGNNSHNNMIYLEEISKSTKQILKSAYLQLYHANSLAYNDIEKEIYVTAHHRYDNNDNTIIMNDIIIVDYNTFTIKNTVIPNITGHARSVSYDNKNNVLAIGDKTDLWIMENWNTVKRHITLNMNNTCPLINPIDNNETNQTLLLFDNIIYASRLKPNGITLFDINGNVLKNYYNNNFDTPIIIQEYEDISVEENGDIYLITVQTSGSSKQNLLQDNILFKSNLNFGGYNLINDNVYQSARNSYYVDSNTQNIYQIGTQNKPFKYIEQAILAMQCNKNDVTANIYLVGNGNVEYGFIESKNNIKFNLYGNNNIINMCKLQQQTARMINCKFKNNNDLNVTPIGNTSNVYFDYCDIELNNCNFYNTLLEKPKNGFVTYSSKIKIQDTIINGFENAIDLTGFNNLYIQYINVQNCTNFWKTKTQDNIHYTSNASLRRTNPTSNILPNTDIMQTVDFNYNNNEISFNNPHIDTGSSPYRIFIFRFVITINNVQYALSHLINPTGLTILNDTIITDNKSKIYHINIRLSHTEKTGIYTLNPSVIEEDVTTSSITNISNNVEIKTTSIIRL